MTKTWVSQPEARFNDFLRRCDYSENSCVSYRTVFFSFLRFLTKHELDLSSVTENIIKEWLRTCSIRAKTEIRYIAFFASVFNELVEELVIEENYAAILLWKRKNEKTKIKGKAGRRLPVALNEKEFESFYLYTHSPNVLPRVRVVATVLAACGLRVDELCNLKVSDVHLDVEYPYLRVIGKANKEREVPIPDAVCAELEAHVASLPSLGGAFVGLERNGKLVPYSNSGIYKMIRGLMRKCEIVKAKISPHVLRHTYATRQLQAGIPLATLSLWLGHDSIATTMVYQHAVVARTSVRPIL